MLPLVRISANWFLDKKGLYLALLNRMWGYVGYPHFLVNVKTRKVPLCYNDFATKLEQGGTYEF